MNSGGQKLYVPGSIAKGYTPDYYSDPANYHSQQHVYGQDYSKLPRGAVNLSAPPPHGDFNNDINNISAANTTSNAEPNTSLRHTISNLMGMSASAIDSTVMMADQTITASNLRRRITILEGQLSDSNAECERLRGLLASCEGQINHLASELGEARNSFLAQERTLQNFKTTNAVLKEYKDRYIVGQEKIGELEELNSQQVSQVEALEKHNFNLQETLNKQEIYIKKMQEELTDRISFAQEREKENGSIKKMFTALQEENRSLIQKLNESVKQQNNYTEENKTLKEKILALSQENIKIQAKVQTKERLKGKINELLIQIGEVIDEI